MKKTLKLLGALITVSLVAAALVACGAKPSGNYVIDEFSVTTNGVTISGKIEDLASHTELDPAVKFGLGFLTAMRLEFEGDTLTIHMLGQSESVKFKMKGNKILGYDEETGKYEDMEQGSFTYKGGKLQLSMSETEELGNTEVTVTFKKL